MYVVKFAPQTLRILNIKVRQVCGVKYIASATTVPSSSLECASLGLKVLDQAGSCPGEHPKSVTLTGSCRLGFPRDCVGPYEGLGFLSESLVGGPWMGFLGFDFVGQGIGTYLCVSDPFFLRAKLICSCPSLA